MADKRRVLLEDVITHESVARLRQAFEDGLDLVVSSTRPGGNSYTIHKDMLDEAGEPVIRYVYQVLRASAVYDPASPFPGFPWRSRVPMTHILRQYLKGSKGLEAPNEYTALIGSINRLMVRNDIARIASRGKTYLTDWPEGKHLHWTNPSGSYAGPLDPVVEKRITEEKDKPVAVYRNLRTVKLPASFDADSVKQWIKTFVPAALALQDEYDKLRTEVAELQDKLEAIEAAKANKEWEDVGEELSDLMGGGGSGRSPGATT